MFLHVLLWDICTISSASNVKIFSNLHLRTFTREIQDGAKASVQEESV